MDLDTSKLLEAVGKPKQADSEQSDALRFGEGFDVPIELTDADLWANYVNDDLYEMDKKIRELLGKTRYRREKNGGYKTTASFVFAWLFGRQPEPSDSAVCRMIHELLRYYCTSYTGQTTFMGKRVSRVYRFSRYATTRKRPYSLRLRLEEMEDGKNPWRKSPVDDSSKRSHGRREHS